MGYWLKSYTDILDDPKYFRLSTNAQLAMHECFLIAKKLEGVEMTGLLPGLEEIAFHSRKPIEFWTDTMKELIDIGIVIENQPGYLIKNYVKRQKPISSTIRAKMSKESHLWDDDDSRSVVSQKPDFNLPERPGIYKITNTKTNKFYIGASKNINKRVSAHLTEMKTVSGHPLYDDFLSANKDYKFVNVEIICLCEENELGTVEDEYIKKYKDDPCFSNNEGWGKNHHSWSEEPTYRWGEKSKSRVRVEKEKSREREEKDEKITTFPSLITYFHDLTDLPITSEWNEAQNKLVKEGITPSVLEQAWLEVKGNPKYKIKGLQSMINSCIGVKNSKNYNRLKEKDYQRYCINQEAEK